MTISLAYALDTAKCPLASAGRCFGRDPGAYRELLSDLMLAVPPSGDVTIRTQVRQKQKELLDLRSTCTGDPLQCPVGSFADPELARKLANDLGTLECQGTTLEQRFHEDLGFAALENLFDNQPQLAVVGSFHSVGRYGGPDEWSIGLELQFGSYNLNRLRRDSAGDAGRAVSLLQSYAMADAGMSKLVFSVSCKSAASFHIDQLNLGDGPVGGFSPVDQRSTSELTTKLQWGRKIAQKLTRRQPRIDVSIEGIEAFEDTVRTKNRWVATTTLTIPLADTIALPVSVTWANKPEFLGQPAKRLGAHLGLTYKLPWEKNPGP
jgi:hypothetical protein